MQFTTNENVNYFDVKTIYQLAKVKMNEITSILVKG